MVWEKTSGKGLSFSVSKVYLPLRQSVSIRGIYRYHPCLVLEFHEFYTNSLACFFSDVAYLDLLLKAQFSNKTVGFFNGIYRYNNHFLK